MKKTILLTFCMSIAVLSCDLIDGTGIENPNLPVDDAVNLPNAARPWVNGLNEQIASVYGEFLTTAELSTDNYINVQTFYNQNVDNSTYRDIDDDFDDTQRALSTLREQAIFGLDRVLENDPSSAGTELEAEMYFFKGLANLMLGELTTAFPAEAKGATVDPATLFQNAIQDFNNALNIDGSSETAISYRLALARTHYNLGNQSEAVSAANAAIAADGNDDYIRFVEFDGVNGPFNNFQDAVYDRGNFDDLQPLPRLDYLDPKYAIQGTDESPVPMFKIEEAYLIVAEAQLAGNDLPGARSTLQDLLAIVNSRPTRDFDETAEGRVNAKTGFQRPNSSSFIVRASSSDPFKSGLVLDRTESTTVPTVSGTSVTAADITALSSADGDALETLYLMRQEIFFGEGRRIFDLGIRWPVHEIEALNNPNITAADRTAVVPSFLPTGPEMDAFTVSGNEVTISFNVNRIIAQQRGNRFN